MHRLLFNIFTFTFAILIAPFILMGNTGRFGQIHGTVTDVQNQLPLTGANVLIAGTQWGAAVDTEGKFTIPNVPVGSYSIRITYIGYEQKTITDVIVRSKRITFVQADLRPSIVEGEVVTVTGGYFEDVSEPTSMVNFSHEEVRRAPGSAGDVSRILMVLPSVAKVNDQQNSLIVRGGSPIENGFYIDHIEVPNINHFPAQGSSGGPIGLINVDFIRDVNFLTGGFSSHYGDRLSSVMALSFREGNREEFDGQLDLNFAGFGGTFEGPLPGGKGSYLFSVRRSYLDLIIDAIDAGTTVAPRYGDYQGKLVWDLHPRHKLSLLSIRGDDHSWSDRDVALENDMIVYGAQDWRESTTGLHWRALWHPRFYSNTALSYTSQKFHEDYTETASNVFLLRNRSRERWIKLRHVNRWQLGLHALEFGLDAKHLMTDYDNFIEAYTDALGNPTPRSEISDQFSGQSVGAFCHLIFRVFNRIQTNFGVRTDYFSVTERSEVSPRFSLQYHLTDRTTLSGSAGLFYQNLPLVLLYQNPENSRLKTPRARHLILGIEHMLTPSTRLTLELYRKDYAHFPVDPSHPELFLIDELTYRYNFFFHHETIRDNGRAYARGIELMIQKKLAERFYGLVSASVFNTRYDDGVGWRDRVYDNQTIFSVEGGYKPDYKWEFSLRWIYAGGAPYTPFDAQASSHLNRAVLDETRINESRYPAYHSMNVRFDRRFHYKGSNLIFYFSVWNLYNRKNIAQYFWNETENKPDVSYQWSLLPIFGLEYEF